MKKHLAIAYLAVALVITVGAQEKKQQNGEEEHRVMESRGDQAMGFSHEKTTHHFRLYKDGGAIEVSADDPKDAESRNMIRMHLSHIAKMFADGNFDAPMFIHDTTPPGVPAMKELREQISYQYKATDFGGRIRIQTASTTALAAVHDFLRFQIAEHKTGDTTEVTEAKKPD